MLGYDDAMWHHAACTYHPRTATVSLYVDGELAAEAQADRPEPPPSAYGVYAAVPLRFERDAVATAGATADLAGDGFLFGYLDEIRLWSKTLSPDEVRRRSCYVVSSKLVSKQNHNRG